MGDQRYLVYAEGGSKPIGFTRESMLEGTRLIFQSVGKSYRLEAVTSEIAEEVMEVMTEFPSYLEELFSKN